MAVIGYYSMVSGQGDKAMIDDIKAAGHEPLQMNTLSPAELANVDALYVWNGSNSGYGAEFVKAMPGISAAVSGGMDMVVFDRAIGAANPQAILPGTSLKAVRYLSADANLTDAGEAALSGGPAAGVDDKVIDGGNYTTHGYVDAGTLPAGADVLMTPGTDNPQQAVGFVYDYGAGSVQYYGIPMDFFNEQRQGWENLATNTLNYATLCLTAGTRIATPQGLRRVEALRLGDLVQTLDHGAQPVRWISVEPGVTPLIWLPSGLQVTAQHRVLHASAVAELWHGAREVLIPALAWLGQGGRIGVSRGPVYNLLFDRHEVIMADGVAVESLLSGPQARRSRLRLTLSGVGRLSAVLRCAGVRMQACRPLLSVAEGRSLLAAQSPAVLRRSA